MQQKLSKKDFSTQLANYLDPKVSGVEKSEEVKNILCMLGFEKIIKRHDEAVRRRPEDKKVETLAVHAPKEENFTDGNLKIKARYVNSKGVVEGNKITTEGLAHFTQMGGKVKAKAIKIVSDYIALAESSELSFQDKALLKAHETAITNGKLVGGKKPLKLDENGEPVLDEDMHDALLEIKARHLLGSSKYDVDGEVKVDVDGTINLSKNGKVKAYRITVNAHDGHIDAPVEVVDAFFNAYNGIKFGNMDNLIVKNYLKINFPTAN